jgi:hypothetical protein
MQTERLQNGRSRAGINEGKPRCHGQDLDREVVRASLLDLLRHRRRDQDWVADEPQEVYPPRPRQDNDG